MFFKLLKRLRVVVSLSVFLLILLFFIDFSGRISVSLINSVLFLEFVPSLLSFLSLLTLGTIGFIFIILLTFLFGRIYCSTLCPLGTMQDIVIYFKKKFGGKKRFKFIRTYNWIRYSILAAVVLFLLFGNILLLTILDPYSAFGKISVTLVKPVFILINNFSSKQLAASNIFWFKPIETTGYSLFAIIFSSAFLILVLWFSIAKGRLYCNTVCPVGAFLGLISKASVFKIRINEESCTSCGLCSSVCKAGCIENKTHQLDFSRCVGCMNCLSVCKAKSINYHLPVKNAEAVKTDSSNSRRKFIATSVLFTLGMTFLAFGEKTIQKTRNTIYPNSKKNPVTPPGSVSVQHFTDKCTACQLCISICPTQVLKPSVKEYGLNGIMQPHMNYEVSFCNYDCHLCTQVCPNGALLPLTVKEKQQTQLGIAQFIEKNCVVYTNHTACGACSEHCPTKAVHMIPYTDNLVIPKVDESICIGCGACEFSCPTQPYKAIYVEGNVKHLQAQKPVSKDIKQKVNLKEDFPF